MKSFISAVVIIALTSTTALAGGNFSPSSNANANQAQGQIQGQAQAQKQRQGQHQGQGQSQSASANNRQANSQSTTVNNEGSAFAPGFGVDGCAFSLSAGWIGGGAGVGIPSRNCAVEREALMIYHMTGDENLAMQHLHNHNTRIRRTMRDAGRVNTVTSKSTTTKVSTRNRDTASWCSVNASGQLVVKVPRGASEEVRAARIAACQ